MNLDRPNAACEDRHLSLVRSGWLWSCSFLVAALLVGSPSPSQGAQPQSVTIFAGRYFDSGTADGPGCDARFNFPSGLAVDGTGNLYVADSGNNTIRKITPTGVVTTLAGSAGETGSGDGMGSNARFNSPLGLTVDGNGTLYVADTCNSTIRKITPDGLVTTFAGSAGKTGHADGAGNASRFYFPWGLIADKNGNLYVADDDNNTIRKITPGGLVTTRGLASIERGFIRGVTPGGMVTSPAGGCGFILTKTFCPIGVAVDREGTVYASEHFMHIIVKVAPSNVSGGRGDLLFPEGVSGDPSGHRQPGAPETAWNNLRSHLQDQLKSLRARRSAMTFLLETEDASPHVPKTESKTGVNP